MQKIYLHVQKRENLVTNITFGLDCAERFVSNIAGFQHCIEQDVSTCYVYYCRDWDVHTGGDHHHRKWEALVCVTM